MKRLGENPKPEGRSPTEDRRPKSEQRSESGVSNSNLPVVTWRDEQLSKALVLRESNSDKKHSPRHLGERTAEFGENIIEFAKRIPQTPVNSRLISQLVGSGSSVGANYYEADDAVSCKEFKQKIGTCRKESKETMFFLRMIAKAEPSLANEARVLWREAKELNLIFGAIWRK